MSSSSPSPKYKYLLQAVVVHHGAADGGHYTTYRRVSPVSPGRAAALLGQAQQHQQQAQQREQAVANGGPSQLARGLLAPEINTWVHVSDESVVAASVEEVLSCEAYMLFYQSLESLRDASCWEEGTTEAEQMEEQGGGGRSALLSG